MKQRVELAELLFKEGFNCSQSVFAVKIPNNYIVRKY
jgi:hypothetical protein